MRPEYRRRLLGGAVVVLAGVVVVVAAGGGGGGPPVATTEPSVTSTTTTVTSPPPSPPALQFGASVNRLFNDFSSTPAESDAQLTALRATGATIARSDALWEASEPAPPTGGVHHFVWGFDDRIASSLAIHGLRWLPIVDYTAPWAQSIPNQDHSPPNSFADYAAYAAALAGRYGSNGSFWREHPSLPQLPVQQFEIWNEPNNPAFWVPAPDPAAYDRLYADARGAIEAVDPSAAVLVGGLAHGAPRFLSEMLASDPALRTAIDGVAIHPYARSPAGVLSNVVRARQTLVGLGLGATPLYVTEFGWTTSPPGAISYLPERLRPGYIAGTIRALAGSGCGLAAIILYTWSTPEQDPRNSEDWYGISPPGAGQSADTVAFTQSIRQATDAPATASGCG